MPLTDDQKITIGETISEANNLVQQLSYAVNRAFTVIADEALDPAGDYGDAVGMVNQSKAQAILLCDELKLYLQGLADFEAVVEP